MIAQDQDYHNEIMILKPKIQINKLSCNCECYVSKMLDILVNFTDNPKNLKHFMGMGLNHAAFLHM